MKRKILFALCNVMLLVACVFVPNRASVFAEVVSDTTKPTINVSRLELQQEYDQGDYLDIDKSEIELSDNVDSAETLLATLEVKLIISSNGVSREIVNTAESSDFYSFLLTHAGDYTLDISVRDSSNNLATYSWTFKVIDSSVINAKYENGGNPIDVNTFGDSALYSELLKYIENYAQLKGDKFTGTTLTDTMFLQPDITELVIKGDGISSISGLAQLKLEYVETLSIVGGSISSVTADNFSGFRSDKDAFGTEIKLKNINFAKNNISSFSLPSLRNLTSLNLSSNSISELDLSNCWGDEVDINLAGNVISDIENISMPRADKINLNLIGNKLYTINEGYFSDDKYSLKIGVQGALSSSEVTELDTQNGLRYFKSNVAGLSIEIYDMSGRNLELVKTIDDSAVVGGNYVNVDLPIGKYVYKYVLNGEDAYNRSDVDKCYYVSRGFVINPAKPTYMYEYKGEMYESLGKVTGAVKLHLKSPDVENGVNAKIMYSISGKEWIEGDVVDCNTGGSISVRMKVVVGDYESEEVSLLVKTSLNAVIPDVAMFFIVLFVGLIIFAVIMPIVSKKFFRK